MADFLLDRIRFKWRAGWTTGTDYTKDDIVYYRGRVYVCLLGHTAGADIRNDFSKWELMLDGQEWRGAWQTNTIYGIGNIVKYNGYVYRCTGNHTSVVHANLGLPNDIANWTLLATTYDWKNTWTNNFDYNLGDVVRYNGIVYICTEIHTSNPSGLEIDQGKWATLLDSETWKGNWTNSTQYTVNDIVRYGGNVYRCIEGHTSAGTDVIGLEDDQTKWEVLYNGIRYRSNWSQIERYIVNDVVRNDNTLWIATSDSNSEPFDTNKWSVWIPGLGYEEAWDQASLYQVGDIVSYGGYLYTALNNNTNSVPSANGLDQNTGDWEVLTLSYSFKGDYDSSSSYRTGDVVLRGGYLYEALADQTSLQDFEPDIEDSYWKLVTTGSRWLGAWKEFNDDDSSRTIYYLGDVVNDQGTSYICKEQHTADEASTRPKDDAGIDRWNLTNLGDNYIKSVTSEASLSPHVRFSTDRSKMFVSESTGEIYQYTLSDTDDVSTATYDTVSIDPSSINVGFNSFDISTDGSVLIAYGSVSDQLIQYGLSTAFDLSSASQTKTGSLSNLTGADQAYDIQLSSTGEELFVLAVVSSNYVIQAYSLSTPNDIGTATFIGSFDISSQITTARGFAFSGDGKKLFVAEYDPSSTKNIYEYEMSSPWTIGTMSYSGIAVAYSTLTANDISSLTFDNTGRIFYFVDDTANAVNQFDESYAWPNGTYWDVLIQGNPFDVLRFRGDLITYDFNDDNILETRSIQIGQTGNVLKSDENNLLWENFEQVPKVYYVATTGLDSPESGLTVASPFRTIKYATEYILADEASRTPATIVVKTGLYEEELPIVVPATVAIVGDELRSTSVRPAAGYELENMFLMRDSTGLRNMTLRGLNGTLGPPNPNLTRRPTAGAYVSLDPGTGPADTSVHITNRSPYIQNVTTFGTGCIGLKVDGDLHNAGFRSIVANDFTQILSDGIGFWANGEGRSELVSVFTYYCHIGYLTTDGGFVRATNGNNSYGLYGSVAEGFNQDEIPITASVDNQDNDASVQSVILSNNLGIMGFAYSHTGQDYGVATPTVNGTGTGEDLIYDDFRYGAVSEVRITEEASDSAGGANYTFAFNRAQSGTATSLTLSATETGTSATFEGQRISIVGGPGTGQYGYIDTYDENTKVATVLRESDGNPGWDQMFVGQELITTILDNSLYQVEPRVSFEDPPRSLSNSTLPETESWNGIAVGNGIVVAVGDNSTAAYTTDGTNWSSSTITSGNYNGVIYLASSQFIAFGDSGLVSYSSDGGQTWSDVSIPAVGNLISGVYADATIMLLEENTGVTHLSTNFGGFWQTRSIPGSFNEWQSITYGKGKFVAVGDSRVAYTTSPGPIWQTPITLTSELQIPFTSVTYGKGVFVAISYNTDVMGYSLDAITWYDSELSADQAVPTWSDVSYTNGCFLAVAREYASSQTDMASFSYDGRVWQPITVPASANHSAVSGGLLNDEYQFMISSSGSSQNASRIKLGSRAFGYSVIGTGQVGSILITDPGGGYDSSPDVTVFDNSNTINVTTDARINDQTLGPVTVIDPGNSFISALATISGDGFADSYQTGPILTLKNLTKLPGPGDSLIIDGINDISYFIIRVEESSGSEPNLSAKVRISPRLGIQESPINETDIVIRQRYSQIRLTGHDFLDIGTGNFDTTDYPNLYVFGNSSENKVQQFNEVVEYNSGRVFYTSTDQDGNYRVGELFQVEQATGIITISADFFDLNGLQEIRLGGIVVGGTNAVIREFSTDPTMIADSNNIVPTQKAIASFLASRFSGGGSDLAANRLNAGSISIFDNQIETVFPNFEFKEGVQFAGSISGHLAAKYFFIGNSGR